MEETNKLLQELIQKVTGIEQEMKSGFRGVNKRLDAIEYEISKLNTVTKYQDKWDNIPS